MFKVIEEYSFFWAIDIRIYLEIRSLGFRNYKREFYSIFRLSIVLFIS